MDSDVIQHTEKYRDKKQQKQALWKKIVTQLIFIN